MSKTKKAWHDSEDLGRKLKGIFNRLQTKSEKTSKTIELTTIANSMSHCAMQLVNIKRSMTTDEKLEKIEKLLQYIPADVLQNAKTQMLNEK